MIYLKQQPLDEVANKISDMMQNEPGIKEIFETRISRLIASDISVLIMDDTIPVGFINLVSENIDGILFLDMGILEEYRGRGYGKKAIQKLIEVCDGSFDDYIIGETKTTNILANGMSNNVAALVHSTKAGFNYYIFPASRKKEFENSDIYDKFKNHCGNVPTKKKVIEHYL